MFNKLIIHSTEKVMKIDEMEFRPHASTIVHSINITCIYIKPLHKLISNSWLLKLRAENNNNSLMISY